METNFNYFEEFAKLKLQLSLDLENIIGYQIDEFMLIEITKLIRDHDIEILKLKIKNNI